MSYITLFKTTDAITHEPLTILVETITPIGGEPLVVIMTLEGEYETREKFRDARDYTLKRLEGNHPSDKSDIKLYTSITLLMPGTRDLVNSLTEALQSCEEGKKPI